MDENQFFMCEEDNVFDTLSSLYEELTPSPYAGAPGLDPDLEWSEEDYYLDLLLDEPAEVEEAYGVDTVDFQRGDILLAEVYQDGIKRNYEHIIRPFLVIYANAYRVYGFQLTTSSPASLLNYKVEIPNYAACGLNGPGSFMTNMLRGVDIQRLKRRIGHITEEQKQVLLNKLYDIRDNVDGLYTDCPLKDRIDITIENVWRIHC